MFLVCSVPYKSQIRSGYAIEKSSYIRPAKLISLQPSYDSCEKLFHVPPTTAAALTEWLSTVKSLGVATLQATFFWLWRGVRNSSEMLPIPTFSTVNSSNYYLDLRVDKNAYLQMKIGAIHRTPCPNLAFFQTYFLCHTPKYARLPQYRIYIENCHKKVFFHKLQKTYLAL